MSLQQAQQQVDEWVSQYKVGYWKPHEILANLAEEVGELAREINDRFGPKRKKDPNDTGEISEEMADILFTLCCLANSEHIDMDAAFNAKIKKLYVRDHDRYERK